MNAAVCAQCGAILRDSNTVKAKTQRKLTQPSIIRKIPPGSLAVMFTAPLLAYVVGFLLGQVAFENNRRDQIYCGIVAMAIGVFIILLVSYGRITFLRIKYGSKRRRLTNLVTTLVTAAQEETEKAIEEQNTADLRYRLASIFLIANDLEKSVQQFDQAQQLQGPATPQDLNNVAVAMAMRNQPGPAYERFERAITISTLSPQPRFNLARILNQTGREVDAQSAEQKLIEAIRALPKSADLLNQLGLALATDGKHSDAIKAFERAPKFSGKPKDRDALINSRNNIAMVHALAGRMNDAQAELIGILKAEPDNARAAANLGVLLIEQKKYPQAIERLTRALHLDPDLALAHCNLGYAYAMSGAINDAVREFRAAVLLEPNIFEAQYNLGKAYLDEGIYDSAEKSLVRAVQLRKTSWQVHHAIGVLFYKRGIYDKAITAFADCLKLSPSEAVTLSALGVCYVQRGNIDTAYSQLKYAMAHNTHNAEVLTNLSWIQIVNDELHDASDTAKRAVAVDQALAQPANNLGLAQLALGAPEVALDAFKRAVMLDPDLQGIHHHLGNAHIAMKQIDNAVKEWKEAAKLEPGNADIYTNLGVATYRLGRTEEAITEFRRVLKIRTDRKEDYINLGLALASAKHHKEAIEQFDKALAIDPRNAVVHSNRGLACYFGNNVDEALREWSLVTQLDPAYAKRRGKKQESEFDDAIIEYVPLNTNQRALYIEPHTGGFLYRYLPGYETDKWLVVAPSKDLEPVPGLNGQIAKLTRQLRSLDS
jgi:tetratricopeptide (TPR) repeat protein